MSADTHESAGDQIQPGWTWDRLRTVNRLYKLAFLALGIGGSMVATRIIRRIFESESEGTAPNPALSERRQVVAVAIGASRGRRR
jgi:hypothetical protein